MDFYTNQLFHIYNQGNNQRQLFFTDENYYFFLWKMRAYLLPFGDLVAWCLMPNHFHWLFYVKNVIIERAILRAHIDKVEFQRRVKKYGKKAMPVDHDRYRTAKSNKPISLNDAIGDLQKGYTRAINKEKNWTGSLFREECKAKDGWIDEFVTLEKNGKEDFRFRTGFNYGYHCFCYLHNNAVAANMVKNAIDYTWSSAKDYAGLRNGTLCNLDMGRQLRDFI